ncbi:hypothetical protein HK097_004677 [Rhizophlyctis rosea]|uniref:Uncharacterized protein n=1 Tax=Rhizophlyctis rosea TaxID=64517 RepID=A0AAD5S0Z2_9FUNG|nr:hypothetical protein HK097_004677 [Rhizophlyctis rosea]
MVWWNLFGPRPPRKEDERVLPWWTVTKIRPFGNPLESDPMREGVKAVAVGAVTGPIHSLVLGWYLDPKTMLEYVKRDALRRGGLYAMVGGAFIYTRAALAQTREKNDLWNIWGAASVSGVIMGLRAGHPGRFFFRALFMPAVFTFMYSTFMTLEYGSTMRMEDKIAYRQTGFTRIPKRDPYAERWKAIVARGDGEPYVAPALE